MMMIIPGCFRVEIPGFQVQESKQKQRLFDPYVVTYEQEPRVYIVIAGNDAVHRFSNLVKRWNWFWSLNSSFLAHEMSATIIAT